ncbi:MAG: cobalamin-dependent protein [Anaerolineae bacterium]|nr:cobalamin-dependent protein [Anaerolineae bacterium]
MVKEKKLFLVYPTFPSGLFASVSPGLLAVAAHAAQYNPGLMIKIWDERLDGAFEVDKVEGALVGISAMTAQVPRAKWIAARAKEAGAFGVVFGGIHPTICPEEFRLYGAVLRGEIEGGSLVQVLADYEHGRPLALEYYTPVGPLESLPLAPPECYDYAARVMDNMISDARGCPLGCSYCSIHIVSGTKIRHRPVPEIMLELKTRKLLEGNPNIQVTFTNDNFGASPQDRTLLQSVKAELKGRAFRWFVQIGLRSLTNHNFLELANSVGQSKLAVGVESPFRDGLSLEKKGIKGIDPARVFEKIQKYPNIRTRLLLMLGFDFEPSDAFEQMLAFIKQIQPDGVYISILTPFPGTKIGAKLEAEERIFHKNWAHYDTRHLVFERRYTKNDNSLGVMSHDEFMTGFNWLVNEAELEIKKWSRFQAETQVL